MSADFAAELQAKLEEMRLRFNNNAQAGEDATGSLFPLPMVLKHGLAVVATCGFLSFFTALALFIYLSFKLVVWQFAPPKPPKDGVPMGREPESPSRTDVNGFLVPDSHLCPQKENEWDTMAPVSSRSSQVSGGFGATKRSLMERARREPPNQFLILIYNLLFADIQQSIAFFLNVTWLSKNGIAVGNPICYAQGWFVSTGDLASSAFLTAIAIHTYMGVVRNYRLPTWAFYSWIAGLWIFTYGLAIIQVIITDNGRGVGGLYVRAGAWVSVIGTNAARLFRTTFANLATVLGQLGFPGPAPVPPLSVDLCCSGADDHRLPGNLPEAAVPQAAAAVVPLVHVVRPGEPGLVNALLPQAAASSASGHAGQQPGTPPGLPHLPAHLRRVHYAARCGPYRLHGWERALARLLLLCWCRDRLQRLP